ncbi:hypothetical protein CCACVL1_12076 [Corchorus capsularis]|uniref:DUF4378 domain-containing protein n=1 Tax=Corchorus capsularis TaxID=210143 RepID=A0A1R3IHN9_COCAP|nr:hypothetical protein CCACVL1_12076 [Corchorus capsularis]
MAQKHYLHELLQEDQEPFLLKKYIADRRCQLKKSSPTPRTQLQIKKRNPISQNPNFPANFCKNACFFSFHDSPDPRKSPLFEFQSPAKSPCKSPNAIFLQVPARTAALLLEAALRIQKQSSSKAKNNGGGTFGLFGSFLKRLRNRNRKREIANGAKVAVKDILRKMSPAMEEIKSSNGFEMGFSNCSYNGRPSSAVWSESNEEKSLDMDLDTSTTCSQSEDFEEIFMSNSKNDVFEKNSAFDSCDKHFCESPFHFVLQKGPSFGHRTPLFSSPATSPSRHQKQDKENYEVESLKKLQVEEEEEEKEQCSPVSVLDPPFEDDDEQHVDDDDENDGYDLECSYAIVQRAKQHLLHKLRRFEKLAELDPIELEKRMLEEEQDDDDDIDQENCIYEQEEEDELELESASSDNNEMNVNGFVHEVLKSSFHNLRHIPEDMKRLVSDLIAEEQTEQDCDIVKRVCKRLESWKEVESNTIDMMVEQDFRRELDGWKRNQEQIRETALEVEYAIFGLLMEELSEELVSLNEV